MQPWITIHLQNIPFTEILVLGLLGWIVYLLYKIKKDKDNK